MVCYLICTFLHLGVFSSSAWSFVRTPDVRTSDQVPAEHKLEVITTFSVIADMVRAVAGDLATVKSIVPPGVDVHRYHLTPSDLYKARDANLILLNGLNLELWFTKFFSRLGDIPTVVVSDGISLVDMTDGPRVSSHPDHSPTSYCERIECSEERECKVMKVEAYKECMDKIQHNNSLVKVPNPHAWVSPMAALVYINNIRDALVKYDPANAEKYEENAEEYKDRIARLIISLSSSIRDLPPEKRWIVTSEAAFSYLARDFGLKELYLWPVNNDQIGTPGQVRTMIDKVRNHGIKVIFSESTVSPRPAQMIARDTMARYGGILYADSLSNDRGPVPTYLDLLEVTAFTLARELSR